MPQKEYELALNKLKSIINIPLKEEIDLSGSLDSLPLFPQNINVDEVLNSRDDYQAMLLEAGMRDNNVSLEFANHLPSLKGRFSYLFSAQSDEFSIENDFDNYVIGVTLTIPIYSGGNTSAQVQKARIELYQAQTRIAQAKDKIEMDLNNVALSLKEADQRIIASEKNISAAERAYEIAEARANNGLATQLELKDSRLFLDQARLNDLKARFDFLKAYYQWQLTTGSRLEEY